MIKQGSFFRKIFRYRMNNGHTAVSKIVVDTRLLQEVASASPDQALALLEASPHGLTPEQVETRQKEYGRNEVAHEKPPAWYIQLAKAFYSPFTVLLVVLASVSYVTDVRLAEGAGDWTKIILLLGMIVLSGGLRFLQEYRSMQAAEKLKAMVRTSATVLRPDSAPETPVDWQVALAAASNSPAKREVAISDIVPGDIVLLSAGDMIPADLRLLSSKDLFISQSVLTGESLPVEKYNVMGDVVEKSAKTQANNGSNVLDMSQLCFMGTSIVSGSGVGVVVNTGDRTYFGSMAGSILGYRPETSFDKGVNKVTWVLIRFTLVMVPIVFLINGLVKGNWFDALLFALAVAVGVTPEMLPMVVSANLAKGSVRMSRKKVVVKRLNSIQNFGAMDILCTDKTGTLTQDKVIMEQHLDVEGNESHQVLRMAFLNSYHQTGLKNLLDVAVINHAEMDHEEERLTHFTKVDEIPFDFNRRRMSVIVQDDQRQHILICKGALEEIFRICDRYEVQGTLWPFDDWARTQVTTITNNMNEDGMRVIAVAYRTFATPAEQKESYSVYDEQGLVLTGLIGFLDPPKESAGRAVMALHNYGVEVKILTGDNDIIARKICRDVGVPVQGLMLGQEVDVITDKDLADRAEATTIFAKLNPLQKSRVILALRSKGHTVGYMGDGINDASALRDADVGISVDTAVDIAKESADIILLEKDLMVLEEGVVQGRAVFGNIVKYIKMAASSNFGNMFSVLPASAFLPFLPMLPLHILILNLIYDITQLSLPWDNMDEEFLRIPRKWDASGLTRFMVYIGPCSSVYDLTTYYLMFFVFGAGLRDPVTGTFAKAGLFQAGWFVESMMSQTLIIHMIRTQKIPFIQSVAALPVILATTAGISAVCIIPFTALGASVGMMPLPWEYWLWLAAMIVLYLLQTQAVKVAYMKKFKQWL